MSEIEGRHDAWLHQAEEDLRWGRDSLTSGHFSQACFIAQQVGDKAIKALVIYRGLGLIKSNSIAELANKLEVDRTVYEMGLVLDPYYNSGRYTENTPGATAPVERFTKQMAESALSCGQYIFDQVATEIRAIGAPSGST